MYIYIERERDLCVCHMERPPLRPCGSAVPFRRAVVCRISLLRLTKLTFVDSKLPGYSPWA